MQGKLDIRYNFPDNAKLKSRFVTPEGVDFTKTCRKAIEEAVIEVLNTNALTMRVVIEKKLKEAGLEVKKEAYQKQIDADSKSMLRCLFGTKENAPVETPIQAAGSETEVEEPEVKPVDMECSPADSVGQPSEPDAKADDLD